MHNREMDKKWEPEIVQRGQEDGKDLVRPLTFRGGQQNAPNGVHVLIPRACE